MEQPITTTAIDIAAAYMALTGNVPPAYFQPGEALGIFELPGNDVTRQLFTEYATGTLYINIKRFCSCRAFLFRQLKGGHTIPSGGEP